MSDTDYFYHWTHRGNLGSVLAAGLDPVFSECKLPVVWFCDAARVGWALKHIAERHAWNPDEMVLLRFPIIRVPYAHTAYHGVYTTNKVIRINRNCAVKESVLGDWKAAVTVRRNMGNSVQIRRDTDTPNPPPSA